MPAQAELQELFAKAAQTRDASLATQDVLDAHNLVLELRTLAESVPEIEGVCSVASLTLLFGPEKVSMADGQRLRDLPSQYDFILEQFEPLFFEEGWNLKFPSSSSEFISLMEGEARGALVYSTDDVSLHVVGVIPAWKPDSAIENDREATFLLVDSDLPEIARKIGAEDLAELYATALIHSGSELEDNEMTDQRAIFVFTQ